MIKKSGSCCAAFQFCYHSQDYRPNWTPPLSPNPITNKNHFETSYSCVDRIIVEPPVTITLVSDHISSAKVSKSIQDSKFTLFVFFTWYINYLWVFQYMARWPLETTRLIVEATSCITLRLHRYCCSVRLCHFCK